MAARNTYSDVSSFKCMLCLRDCMDPRELPCYHAFCFLCIDKYIRNERVISQEKTYFPCPACDHPVLPKEPTAPASKWATSLPVNLPFHNPGLHGSRSEVAKACDACLRDDQKVTAHVWCRECMEAICKTCGDAHGKNKMSSKHTTIPWEDYARTSYSPVVSVNETCPEHDGKRLELFCLDHNSLCCSMCITLSHRSCQRYKSIDNIVSKTKLYSQQSEWSRMKEETGKLVNESENNREKLELRKKALLETMSANVQRSKNTLDDLFTRFQENVDHVVRSQSEVLWNREKFVKGFFTNVENCNTYMALLDTQGSSVQRFIGREQTISQISSHFRRLHHKVKDIHNDVDLILNVNEGLDKILHALTSLGRVDVSTSKSSSSQDVLTHVTTLIDTLNVMPTSPSLADTWAGSDMLSDVQQVPVVSPPTSPASPASPTKTLDVLTANLSMVKSVACLGLGGAYKIHLTGGVYIDGEGVILTDCKNNRLVLFNETYDYMGDHVLEGQPIDVTRGCKAREVLVAMHLNKTILRCNIQGGVLTTVDKISVPEFTYGIAVFGTSILTGTFNDVKLLSIEGRELKSIPKTGDCAYVAASNSQRTFCHRDGNAIVCRAQDGTEAFRYACRGLREPRGIGLDKDGNIYVCVYETGNIHQISWEGSRTRVIMQRLNGIAKPCAIVVHPHRHELLVTSQKEDVAFEVYKFDSS
ncbi:uncharacterized protein LOC110464376 [Mizuhopecten yessoensis]|uniref:E3 ubiquitin-protein ligase TRIM56 n=1 Tax=Mizuhopecten yessoensis TaxID=6573 RepID=A0A210PU21_MIZYE|nr:uncharacterized protein LOC110464376 [Mizuhopecten yessoensis]OWF40007.1 E3 ubiquitin-protein ligase TRIM56 [Mizuhopecten yessoensis]